MGLRDFSQIKATDQDYREVRDSVNVIKVIVCEVEWELERYETEVRVKCCNMFHI